MNDPFLLAHGISPKIYDISSGLRPGSIRDQIIRGTLLIDRAIEARVLGPEQSLLVVGGGVAGAAAALFAIREGIPTTLLERDEALSRQYNCETRQLEPALYDWPATHWHEPRFPWQGEYAPLTYMAGKANEIARRWRSLVEQAGDALTYVPFTVPLHVSRDNPPQYDIAAEERRPDRTPVARAFRADMIVFAAGSGEEKVKSGPYFRSFKFWDTDTLDIFAGKRALIAGSGDGAVQDFLRLLLKPDADPAQVLDALDIDRHTIGRIQTLAAQADAAFVWSGADHHEHSSEGFIHRQMHAITGKYWRDNEARILKIFDDHCRPDAPAFTFVHPCEHFTRGFPCNRLLALLALRWCTKRNARPTLLPNKKVTLVKCIESDHHTAQDCASAPHRVQVETAGCPARPALPDQTEWLSHEYDLVLLRVGTTPETLPDVPVDPAVRIHRQHRQILPYHLAHAYSSVGS
jgi:FAD dependent oxidoreductase